MIRNMLFILLALALWAVTPAARAARTTLTVLQWNIWQEGTQVKGGYDAIINEIVRLKPDFVTFSEVRNYHNRPLYRRLLADLQERGLTYYSFYSYDSGLLSRHPITDSTTVYPEKDDHGSIYRLVARVGNQEVAVYTAHLDYLNDAYYNVRGYDGSTWQEIPIPTTVREVLEVNDRSQRDDAIRQFIQAADADRRAGRMVLLGGDFNEPSHLDWTRATKDLYDHHGFIIPWTVTLLLDNAGYMDAWRERYPDVLAHPGFTFPSDNPDVPVSKLAWAPKADERDRIDYIFYAPSPRLRLKNIRLFGPEGCIAFNRRTPDTSDDRFIRPLGTWPTDHKALLATFRLQTR